MLLMTPRNQRNRSEKTREIAENSDDIVELEMPYELEHLGALYGRSDDIIMVRDSELTQCRPCSQSAARRERFDDVSCPLVIYDR